MLKLTYKILMISLLVSMMGADQKPYHMDPDQIMAKKELFYGNENANNRQYVLWVATSLSMRLARN